MSGGELTETDETGTPNEGLGRSSSAMAQLQELQEAFRMATGFTALMMAARVGRTWG